MSIRLEKKGMQKIVGLLVAAVCMVMLFLGMSGKTAYAVGDSIKLTKVTLNGTVVKDPGGNLFYKSSYRGYTYYLPYQSDWSPKKISDAMINFYPNTNTTTGNLMKTAGFRYVKNGVVNNNIKLYGMDVLVHGNSMVGKNQITLPDGTEVEFRYLGYNADGTVVSNPFFLNDNTKDMTFQEPGYETHKFNDIDVYYKEPVGYDREAVRQYMDLLSIDAGWSGIVLDGKKTQWNEYEEYAKSTFDLWFGTTSVGKNYYSYSVKNFDRLNKELKEKCGISMSSTDDIWMYWNEYMEIDGNINEGSVTLYHTTRGGRYYRTYSVPVSQQRNVVAHKIELYDGSKQVGYGIQENTNQIYADSVTVQKNIQLSKGKTYSTDLTFKYLVREEDEKTEESFYYSYVGQALKLYSSTLKREPQTAYVEVYFGENNIDQLSTDARVTLTNDDGAIHASERVKLGDEYYYWVTTSFETTFTIPDDVQADVGAIRLIVPGIYQEHGDNYEICDDSLMIEFDIIDPADMKFVEYNPSADREWKTGDTTESQRIWMEDMNGNVLKEYTRNVPFYICYAYEQSAGENPVTDPSIDVILWKSNSVNVQGAEVFSDTLTVKGQITKNSPPTIYKQLVVVEYKATQAEGTVYPNGITRLENTPYLNVYGQIANVHTYDKMNNVWDDYWDVARASFKASAADMRVNKVVFTDDLETELKKDITSKSNKPDAGDTVGYYDREETIKIEYQVEQIVYANINIPYPSITRTIYQGVKNADGTISKYIGSDGKPVILKSGTISSTETLWYKENATEEDMVMVTETISTRAEAIYIEYGIAHSHFIKLENDITDSWNHLIGNGEPFIATISCTVADLEVEKEITLYDSKNNPTPVIPNIGETLTVGFNILHMGLGAEQMMTVGGSAFNPYVTLNVKVIDNDKAGVSSITDYDQIASTHEAVIGTATGIADTKLYPGRNQSGWIPKLSIKIPDVQVDMGNITVCGKISTVHDLNKSNIVRNEDDEYCQVFKAERDFEVRDLSYVPTKSVTAETELGLSVTVASMESRYNDPEVVLKPVLTVYNYNYDTSSWDAIYRSQINITTGDWEVLEINVPDFKISENPVQPTAIRVTINDKGSATDWKYQEYVLKETDAALNADPYKNNYKDITVTADVPDFTVCPECLIN